MPKAIAAARKIAAFNSQIVVEPKVDDVVPANIEALLKGMEVILDGTDNFETRYLINDFAVKNSLPWIYSAAVGSYAATMNVLPGETACLACIFPDSPRGIVETCETSGILNSAVNLVASIAATETLKLLVSDGTDGRTKRTEQKLRKSSTHLPRNAAQDPAKFRPLDQRARRDHRRQAPPRLPRLRRIATSFISPAKAARTSPSAAGIPCKSMPCKPMPCKCMIANAPSTSPK